MILNKGYFQIHVGLTGLAASAFVGLALSACSGASGEDISSQGAAVSAGQKCTEGDGYCTVTLQCDNHVWVHRDSDPAKCTSGPGSTTGTTGESCTEGDGYCTTTQQCENHVWVPRDSDPAKCTSGPGATTGGTGESCTEGDGYCTATQQCEQPRLGPSRRRPPCKVHRRSRRHDWLEQLQRRR